MVCPHYWDDSVASRFVLQGHQGHRVLCTSLGGRWSFAPWWRGCNMSWASWYPVPTCLWPRQGWISQPSAPLLRRLYNCCSGPCGSPSFGRGLEPSHRRVSTCCKLRGCMIKVTRRCSRTCRFLGLEWSWRGYVPPFPSRTGWQGEFVTAPRRVPQGVSPWDGRKWARIFR